MEKKMEGEEKLPFMKSVEKKEQKRPRIGSSFVGMIHERKQHKKSGSHYWENNRPSGLTEKHPQQREKK